MEITTRGNKLEKSLKDAIVKHGRYSVVQIKYVIYHLVDCVGGGHHQLTPVFFYRAVVWMNINYIAEANYENCVSVLQAKI